MVPDDEGRCVIGGVEGDVVEDATGASSESCERREGDRLPESVGGEVANYHAQSLKLNTGELPGATRTILLLSDRK